MKKTYILSLIGLSLCAASFAQTAEQKPTAAPPAEQGTPPAEVQAPDASASGQPAADAAPQTPPPSPEEVRKVLSYFLGYISGQQITQRGPVKEEDIDMSVFTKAFVDGFKGNDPDKEVSQVDLRAVLSEYDKVLNTRIQEAVAKNKELSDKKAEEFAKEAGVKKLPSGILAKELTPSDGAKYDEKKDGADAVMSITYRLRLLDGTVVDESEEPIKLPIDNMLPSIADGVKQMPVGAEWELFIPSDKGYGEQGMGPLKCSAPFMFKVKLHGIEKAPAPDADGQQPGQQLPPEVIKQLQEQGLQPS